MNINNLDYYLIYKEIKNNLNNKFLNKIIENLNLFNNFLLFLLIKNIKIPDTLYNKIIDSEKGIFNLNNFLLKYDYLNINIDNFFKNKIFKKISSNRDLYFFIPTIIKIFIKNDREIPNNIMEIIFKNIDYFKYFVNYSILNKKTNIFSNNIYEKISKYPDLSFNVLKFFLEKENKKEIPSILINSLIKNFNLNKKDEFKINYLTKLVELLIKNQRSINNQFINLISKSPNDSLYLAKVFIELKKNIPNKILNSILKNTDTSYKFFLYLINHNRYDLITDKMYKKISKNFNISYNL